MDQKLCNKVQLFISGRSLKDLDAFSKSDPFCVISMLNTATNSYVEVGRTEVARNNLNPNWSTTIPLDYYFEVQQHINFTVYDYDESKPELIGSCETTLGYIVGKGTTIEDLFGRKKKHKRGKLIVRVEEVKESKDIVFLQFSAHHVDKMDTFGKSDPFLHIYRQRGDGEWFKVHSTEVIRNTLDPIWKPFEISGGALCGEDEHRPILIECWDWDQNSSNDFIGHCHTTLAELLQPRIQLNLINPKKQAKKSKYKNSGILEVIQSSKRKIYSFIDYLRGGTQFTMMVAIDFTGSNGDYSAPSSLHYLNPNTQNEYERAMWAVGSILDNYDQTKMYPVFGFGGKPSWLGRLDHCFALNGNPQNPFIAGIPGIVQAYHQALPQVILSGPTLFQHVIRNAINVARSTPPGLFYHVLLIMTDGEIHDMDATIASIVEASCLPLSIIIVGLGNDNFGNMEALDSDGKLLRDNSGRTAVRDIVQFVPFRKFGGNPYLLAQEVLAEIPKQITGFMQSIGHVPIIPEEIPLEMMVPVQTARLQHHDTLEADAPPIEEAP